MTHLTDQALLDAMYSGEENVHIHTCVDCQEKLRGLQARWSESRARVDPSVAFLARQRSAVMDRIESPQRNWRWVPSLAGACLVLAVGVFYHSAQPPVMTNELTDEQVVSNVFAAAQVTGPQAAQPIQGLFDTGN